MRHTLFAHYSSHTPYIFAPAEQVKVITLLVLLLTQRGVMLDSMAGLQGSIL
jgi:hypothetical protein